MVDARWTWILSGALRVPSSFTLLSKLAASLASTWLRPLTALMVEAWTTGSKRGKREMRRVLQCMVMRRNVMLKLFVERNVFGRRWFFGLSNL